MNKAAELYTELCKLPIEEQKIFLEWAKKEVKKIDKELKKQKEKQNELNGQAITN